MFMQSGYGISRLELEGNWVACGMYVAEQSDWCRVTDAHGAVVYEGDYLPLRSPHALLLGSIEVSSQSDPARLWVKGPAEGSPVSIIRLVGGKILVPADDRDALAGRWTSNRQELQNLMGQ